MTGQYNQLLNVLIEEMFQNIFKTALSRCLYLGFSLFDCNNAISISLLVTLSVDNGVVL